jgi:putative ABC transport system ATP-binding protein
MILADEPTASLDTDRGLSVMRLLRKVSTEKGTAILVVTHDERMIGEVDRVLQLVDGAVVSDESQKQSQSEAPKAGPKMVTDNREKPNESAVPVGGKNE